jgi:hypothetical protein
MIFDITKEQFSKEVERTAKDSKGDTPYVESVMTVLKKYSLDDSQAEKLLTKPLLEKLQLENLEYNITRVKKGKNRLLFT